MSALRDRPRSLARPWTVLALALLLAVGVSVPRRVFGEATAPPSAPRPAAGERNGKPAGEGSRARHKPSRRSGKPARTSKRKPSRGKKKPSRARRSRSRGVRHLDTSWHRPGSADDCEALATAPDGSWGLMSLGAKRCIAVPPIGTEGLEPSDAAEVREAFVDKRHGGEHEIDLRLLRVLQRAVRHFDVPYVHLISGFRPGRSASRHAHGLAADVVFPGVTNRDLARFMRQQGFMGVGIYMRTGFVHVDLRERSYFWLDWSPPGKKWRGKPILMDEAREADAAAQQRGETPFEAPGDLTEALEARRARKARARAARAARQKAARRRAAARDREAKRRAAARAANQEEAKRSAAARRRAAARRSQDERGGRAEPLADADAAGAPHARP